jgi:hypothetical protein
MTCDRAWSAGLHASNDAMVHRGYNHASHFCDHIAEYFLILKVSKQADKPVVLNKDQFRKFTKQIK